MDVRRELRRLRDDGAVNIADAPAFGRHHTANFGQQHAGVRAFEARIGVGEMAANVAQRSRAQQRIGDSVQQHVSIGVAQQAHRMGNMHAANDERTAGHQRVGVPTLANTELGQGRRK